jgi:hypothetical protein
MNSVIRLKYKILYASVISSKWHEDDSVSSVRDKKSSKLQYQIEPNFINHDRDVNCVLSKKLTLYHKCKVVKICIKTNKKIK